MLPISWNPGFALGGRSGIVGATLGRLWTFIDVKFWLDTGIPAASGFFGSKAVGAIIIDLVSRAVTIPAQIAPFAKIAADALSGGLLSWGISRFYSKKAGDAFWLGTVVNVAHAVLKQLLGGTAIAKTIGLDGLGDDLAARMKDAIAQRVANNLNGGMGEYLRTTNAQGLNEYVTDRALRMRGGYAPGPSGNLKDYDVNYQGVEL